MGALNRRHLPSWSMAVVDFASQVAVRMGRCGWCSFWWIVAGKALKSLLDWSSIVDWLTLDFTP